MLVYTIKRFFEMVIVFFLFLVISYLLFNAIPGNAFSSLLLNPLLPPEAYQKTIEAFGLDKPLFERVQLYIINFFKGDFGYSYTYYPRTPIKLIAERLPRALMLFSIVNVVAFYTGFLVGKILAWRRGSKSETWITIGSVFVSGLGLKFTQSVIDLSGGILFILICLTAISAIILGMGMTTTAVYITVAALIVPSLIESGIMPIAAHMFAFYFGVVSTITPPVALASFAGAAIAKSPPMSTAVESSKVGIAKYIVPFAFVYNPSLLMEGPIIWSIYSLISVLLAYWCMTLGLEGWFNGKLNAFKRTLALIGSVALLIPPLQNIYGIDGIYYNFIGVLILMMIYYLQGKLNFKLKAST